MNTQNMVTAVITASATTLVATIPMIVISSMRPQQPRYLDPKRRH